MAEFEDETRVREKDFKLALEDGRRDLKKVEVSWNLVVEIFWEKFFFFDFFIVKKNTADSIWSPVVSFEVVYLKLSNSEILNFDFSNWIKNDFPYQDNRRNLEIQLENVMAECAELKLNLSGAEGRVNALETHLAHVEGAKKETEFKLASIHSTLRRTIGFRQEMPRSASPLGRARSKSPRRSRPSSPTKGEFSNSCEIYPLVCEFKWAE